MTPVEETVAPGRRKTWSERLLPPPGPGRRLALATLVNTMGNGAFLTTGTIYFVSSVGMSARAVGLGLSIAGALALVTGVPIGRAADRFGPLRVFIVLCLVQGAAVAGYALVHTWAAFTATACVAVVAERGTAGVRNAYIARLFTRDDRVRTRAFLRSVNNAGISIGSLAGGLALTVNSRPAYVSTLLADAATFFVTAFLLAGLPSGATDGPSAVKRADGRRLVVLRDARFLAVTAAQAVLAFHYEILEIAFPLWVTTRTGLPRWVIPVVLVLSTVGAISLQVPASRGTDTVRGAAKAARRAGWLLAASCVLFSRTGHDSGSLVLLGVLVLAAAVRLAGELLQAASSWGLSFGLAPEEQAGVYQAVFSTGYSVMVMIAPALCTLMVTAPGGSGWLCAGVAFVLAGHVCFEAVRWGSGAATHE